MCYSKCQATVIRMGRRNNVIVSIEFDVSAVCILSLSLSAHRFSDYLNKATTCMLWGDCMTTSMGVEKATKTFWRKENWLRGQCSLLLLAVLKEHLFWMVKLVSINTQSSLVKSLDNSPLYQFKCPLFSKVFTVLNSNTNGFPLFTFVSKWIELASVLRSLIKIWYVVLLNTCNTI